MAELVDAFRADLIKLNRPKESCLEDPRKWWKFAVQSILQQIRVKRNKFSWAAATLWHLDTIEDLYHEANLEMMRATPLGLRLITMEALREEIDFLKRDNDLLRTMLAENIHVEPETAEIDVQCVASEIDSEMLDKSLSKSPSKLSALPDHISDLTATDFTEDETIKLFSSADKPKADHANEVTPAENSSIGTENVNKDNNNNNNAATQPSKSSKTSVSPRSKRGWIDPGPRPGAKNKRQYRLTETINENNNLQPSKPQPISPSPPSSSAKGQPDAIDPSSNIEAIEEAVSALQQPATTSTIISQPTPPRQSRRSHRPSWRNKHEQVLINIYSTPVHKESPTGRSRSRSPRNAHHKPQKERSPSRRRSPPKELITRVDMTYSRQVAIDIINKVRTHNGKRPHGAQAQKDLSQVERTLLRSPFAHVVMRDPPLETKPKTAKMIPSPNHHNEGETTIIESMVGTHERSEEKAEEIIELIHDVVVSPISVQGGKLDESGVCGDIIQDDTSIDQKATIAMERNLDHQSESIMSLHFDGSQDIFALVGGESSYEFKINDLLIADEDLFNQSIFSEREEAADEQAVNIENMRLRAATLVQHINPERMPSFAGSELGVDLIARAAALRSDKELLTSMTNAATATVVTAKDKILRSEEEPAV